MLLEHDPLMGKTYKARTSLVCQTIPPHSPSGKLSCKFLSCAQCQRRHARQLRNALTACGTELKEGINRTTAQRSYEESTTVVGVLVTQSARFRRRAWEA